MTVVLDRPYEFVPPYRGNLWPTAIQTFRLIDWHLRAKEAVLDYECRNADRFAESLSSGHGILLAPNHCRYADPIVLGWLARQVQTHLYAMASWHLFNTNRFEQFALRRMGAFSVFREGNDRKALETAIDILTTGERPLVLFPEGTTNRTNDLLKPLLDGVTFIARAAAKKRAKAGEGEVVIHPVGLKYLCLDDARDWAHEQLAELEGTLSWLPASQMGSAQDLVGRLLKVSQAYLALKEIEFTGQASTGDLSSRRDRLIEQLLQQAEQRYDLVAKSTDDVRERVRKIRAAVSSTFFSAEESTREPATFRRDVERADLAQFLLSFPDEYLTPGKITDTRIVETIQRIQEAIFGKAKDSIPMKVVIDVGEAIPVPAGRPPRGETDPVLCQLRDQLHTMVTSLSKEANLLA
ncbi:1-acyl-sn-glycerol-3-phosphate acyltransferase [Rhodopirellula sp. JC740]|uniref:1-acyl-sn-glycerol-3-phosphate acyltransferase n=1 Tax=Rhodopirellula halodulae TaxID=2894198 RepID=A0ABS8NJV5_9BACT|nr:1-acyl-sn-glycerol-3-phosphate acyltransferase [Rhodopirellula sp. JC740]MCC9643840.1 1-acyl-sn-glycerol-3-phosphate acyltransferase [Rhodopirellula sp. JC740]